MHARNPIEYLTPVSKKKENDWMLTVPEVMEEE
jgi:hypothetical protein